MPKREASGAAPRSVDERPVARYKFQPRRLKLSVSDAARPLLVASLHDRLVARLREMILEGDLAPGSPLPEKMLCATFGVSRTPLREAFKVLAGEGLIELRPHRTPVVTPIDADELADVFEVMIVLDELAARLACVRATDAGRAGLDALHARLVAFHRAGERSAYFRLNQDIHAEIARIAGNPVLVTTRAALAAKIYRARAHVNRHEERRGESLLEHEAFMRHFRCGDANAFAAAVADHTRRTRDAVLAASAAATATDPTRP